MKRLLLSFILIVLILIVVVFGYKTRRPHIIFEEPTLPPVSVDPIKIEETYARYLVVLNERNKRVQTIRTKNMQAYFWHNALRIKLDGELAYQKDMHFHMKLRSIAGEEFDMGSNPQEFWFWSKRLKPCALYYAKQEDIFKTNLKPLFNPVNIMKSLGFDELQVSSVVGVTEQDKRIIFAEKVHDAQGTLMTKLTFIDKDTGFLMGYMISDEGGKCLASTEILGYKEGLPQQIMFIWKEENQILVLDFGDFQVNSVVEEQIWKRPNTQPVVDLGKESVSFVFEDK